MKKEKLAMKLLYYKTCSETEKSFIENEINQPLKILNV